MRTMVVMCLGMAAFAAATSGQGTAAPDRAMQELLAEVKALRVEVNRAAGSSIRAQLLVGRLQLQEQRILTVSRQMDDVQKELAGIAQARAALEMVTKQRGEAPALAGAEDQEQGFDMFKQQLAEHQNREQQLRQQESSLSAMLAEEQARWTDFSSRLDELERALPATRNR